MPTEMLGAEMGNIDDADVRSDVTPALPGEVGEEESVGWRNKKEGGTTERKEMAKKQTFRRICKLFLPPSLTSGVPPSSEYNTTPCPAYPAAPGPSSVSPTPISPFGRQKPGHPPYPS